MATRQQPAGIIDNDPDEDETQAIPGTRQLLTQPEPDPDSEQSVIDRLRAVMATAPGDRIKVKVYRVDPKQPGSLTWCQDYTPAEYEAGDLGMIRDTWGPGRYQIRIICPTGIAARSDVVISAPLQPQTLQVNPAATESPAIVQAMQMMMESQSRILEALQTQAQKPPADPRAEMLANLEMMRAMREAFAPAPSASAPPVSSPVAQLTELLQTMRLFKEAAADIGADKEPAEPSLMSMLPGVLSLVKEGMSPQQPALPAPITVPQSIERPSRVSNPLQDAENAQPGEAPQPPTESDKEMMILILRGQLAQLCKMAKEGKPAIEGGDFLYDQLPEELLPELNNPQWFEILASLAPNVRAYEAWFREAKAEADRLFALPPDDEDEDEAQSAPAAIAPGRG